MPKESELEYRIPCQVILVRKIGHDYFPICPKCSCTMEREYQSYCDRCGQALQWKEFSHAKVVENKYHTEEAMAGYYE